MTLNQYTKQFTESIIRYLVPESNLNQPLLASDYNNIANFFFKSLIVFHVCFLPFTVSFYMNNYEIFNYLNFYFTFIQDKLVDVTIMTMIFKLAQPHVWLLLFLSFVLIWSLAHNRLALATLTNVTLYFIFYIMYYFGNTYFYYWSPTANVNYAHQYDLMLSSQKFFLFHPFTQLLILPFVLMLVMIVLRQLDISREQFYNYLKYSLINFMLIYSLALLNLFRLKLTTFFVLTLNKLGQAQYLVTFVKYAGLVKFSTMKKLIYVPLPYFFQDSVLFTNSLSTSFYFTQIKFFFLIVGLKLIQ